MMELFFYICIFIFGMIVGTFLNCVIYRLQTNENIGMSRSHCVKCGHTLRWYDLIPLLSFLILRGKCRYCGKPISIQYPVVELATGFLFVLIFKMSIFAQDSWILLLAQDDQMLNIWSILDLFYLLIISCFLIVIFVYDLKHYIILDKVIYPAIGIALVYQIITQVCLLLSWAGAFQIDSLFNTLFAAVLAAGFFFAIVAISKGKWMGAGDIKLGFLMGLILGYPQILTGLFLAFLFGAIIGTGLITLKKKTLKSEVPFGPFLVTGTFIAMFWGEQILNWYLNKIL